MFPAEILTQLVSLPTRRKRVVGGTFPNPSTGQPRKSEPHDQRLPSDARMSPCRSPRLMAGVPLPTGSLRLPRLGRPAGDVVRRMAMPAANKIAAPAKALVLSLGQAMTARLAWLFACVESREFRLVFVFQILHPPAITPAHVSTPYRHHRRQRPVSYRRLYPTEVGQGQDPLWLALG